MSLFVIPGLLMLAWGGYIFCTGTLKFFKVEIAGRPARLAGLVLMLPLPLSAVLFFRQLIESDPANNGGQQGPNASFDGFALISMLAALVLAGLIFLVGNATQGRRGRSRSDGDDEGEEPWEQRKRLKNQDKGLANRLAKQARDNARRRAEEAEEEGDDFKEESEAPPPRSKTTRSRKRGQDDDV